MIKNINAIFFDIDGTLVPFGMHKISNYSKLFYVFKPLRYN